MSIIYAELNEDNICTGVSSLYEIVDADYMIPIETMDVTLIGKRYNDGVWEEVLEPVIEPAEEPAAEP